MPLIDKKTIKLNNKIIAVMAMALLGLSFIASYQDTYATEAMTLSISGGTLALNLAPNDSAGTFGKSDLNISVAIAVTGGYNLTITGIDSTGNLTGADDNSHIISSISGTVSESDFSNSANTSYNNKWGYKIAKNSATNNNYVAAPTTTTTLDTVSSFSGTNNYTLTLGARANISTPIDSYRATFVIAAVSTITCNSSATTISTAICMQDINDNVINSMTTDTQYQLMDNRDNKLYYIAKMQDGRVWMTQNLDLDLETTPNKVAALTSDNTNLTTAYATDGTTLLPGYSINNNVITFTPSVATSTTASDWKTTTTAGATTNYNTLPQSFDYGDWYNYTNTSGTTTTYSGANARAHCESAHPDGTCDHYHAGNYYDWTAAVAMNTTNSINYNGVDNNYYSTNYFTAANSICPKGWRLPQGRTNTTTTNVGYYSEANYTWQAENIVSSYITGTATAGVYPTNGYINASNNPLYLARTGYKSGTGNPGNTANAYYWTSTVSSNSNSYSAYLNGSTAPYPIYSSQTRHNGLAVRCVAAPTTNTGSTTITFNKNASDATGTTGTNNTQTINANTLATLTTNGFTRSGYAFNSWNTEPDGSGMSYTDAGTFYAKMGTEATNVTLYAIWDKVWTITFAIGNGATSIAFGNTNDGMQNYTNGQTAQAIEGKAYTIGGNFPTKYGFNTWTTTSSGTLGDSTAASTTYTVTGDTTLTLTGQEATTSITSISASGTTPDSTCKNTTPVRNVQLVYDPRDNEAYWVGELCDGNVWMLDNLRLDLSNSTTLSGLSSSNTNATDTQLNYLRNGGGTTTDKYPTAGLVRSSWSNYYSVPYVKTTYKDNIAPVTYGVGSGKVGVYYNYCAASAGTYCWGNNGNSTGSPTTGPNTSSYRDIDGDICPAGWHLPTSGGTGREYNVLYSAYSGATGGQAAVFRNALSTPLSGSFSSSSQTNLGTRGYFWSSTWLGTNNMYYLYPGSTGANPNNANSRYNGDSIRCVLGSS